MEKIQTDFVSKVFSQYIQAKIKNTESDAYLKNFLQLDICFCTAKSMIRIQYIFLNLSLQSEDVYFISVLSCIKIQICNYIQN